MRCLSEVGFTTQRCVYDDVALTAEARFAEIMLWRMLFLFDAKAFLF